MKRCVKCGKKGLFLWLSKGGYCEQCAGAILAERDRQKKAEIEAMRQAAIQAAIEEKERKKREKDEARRREEEEREQAARERREAYERKIMEFDAILDITPKAKVDAVDQKPPQNSVTLLSDIVYSRITAKSNKQRLSSFVVIDTETTGINLTGNDIIEVSAIKFNEFEPVEIFESLTKPRKPIPKDAQAINGISDAMVADAPYFYQIAPSLQAFISGYNLVGHNLPFDLKFLFKNGLDVFAEKRKYYDTLQIARSKLSKPKQRWNREIESYEIDYNGDYDVENHKLDTLCTYYGICRGGSHRAGSDSLATGMIFREFVEAVLGR